MMRVLLFIFIGLHLGFCIEETSSKSNWIDKIRKHVLTNYSPSARPVKDHSINTTVKFGISVNDVNLDEHAQRMTVIAYLYVIWIDEHLAWNASDFGDLSMIHFDKNDIWVPDVALYNSATPDNISPQSSLPLLGYSNGKIAWIPPYIAKVPCQMDLKKWPSDVQNCSMRFGSWAHHSEEIYFQVDEDNPISVDHFEKNKKWKLLNYSSKNEFIEFEGSKYHYVNVNIVVQRQAASHIAFISNVTLGIMLAILAAYFLPLRYHVSRLLLHLFSLIILVICGCTLLLSLPLLGGDVPFVVRYFSGTIVLTALSLIFNVLISLVLSSSFIVHKSFTKTFMSAFDYQNLPIPEQEMETREIHYTSMNEQLVEDVPKTNSGPAVVTNRNQKNRTILLRFLNLLFFIIFTFAFIIDYSLMRDSINP